MLLCCHYYWSLSRCNYSSPLMLWKSTSCSSLKLTVQIQFSLHPSDPFLTAIFFIFYFFLGGRGVDISRTTLDRHVHRKQKYVQDNHMPFINKNLSNEIMKRSKLRKQFLKDKQNRKKICLTVKLLCVFHFYEKLKKTKNHKPV